MERIDATPPEDSLSPAESDGESPKEIPISSREIGISEREIHKSLEEIHKSLAETPISLSEIGVSFEEIPIFLEDSTLPEPHPATLARPLDELRAILGVEVEAELLALSMTHPSAVGEGLERTLKSNQRLEFLGDSLVGAICAEYFFRAEPESPEGALTNRKISAVRKDALASAAQRLDLGGFLRFGRGEDIAGGRERHSNLSDTFEALVAAVFLSNDWNITRDWVLRSLEPELTKDPDTLIPAKNRLQERTQALGWGIPRYLTTQAAPKTQWFGARVWVGENERGQGEGKSKKLAEENAARAALDWLEANRPRQELISDQINEPVA